MKEIISRTVKNISIQSRMSSFQISYSLERV